MNQYIGRLFTKFKGFKTRLSNKRLRTDTILLLIVILGFSLLAWRSYADNMLHLRTVKTSSVIKNVGHISVASTDTKTKPITTTTPASGVSQKASTPTPTPATVIPKPTSPVVPSPSSSVSSLAPVPSSTPASSGSNTGGSGSSGDSSSPISYSSTNWSGYMANTGTFTTVSGSWTAPQPTGNGTSVTADASWIGIGGVTSSDLIQVGTDNTVEPNGRVITSAFYELLPAASEPINTMTVTAGDLITASISEVSSNQWTIYIKDDTDGQSFSDSVSYDSSQSSAEWIEEDPSYARGDLVPLDNFGTVPFSDCLTTDNGLSVNLTNSNAASITMVTNSDQTVASPSAISSGANFSVTKI